MNGWWKDYILQYWRKSVGLHVWFPALHFGILFGDKQLSRILWCQRKGLRSRLSSVWQDNLTTFQKIQGSKQYKSHTCPHFVIYFWYARKAVIEKISSVFRDKEFRNIGNSRGMKYFCSGASARLFGTSLNDQHNTQYLTIFTTNKKTLLPIIVQQCLLRRLHIFSLIAQKDSKTMTHRYLHFFVRKTGSQRNYLFFKQTVPGSTLKHHYATIWS